MTEHVYCYGGPLHDQMSPTFGGRVFKCAVPQKPRKFTRQDAYEICIEAIPMATYKVEEFYTVRHTKDMFRRRGVFGELKPYVVVSYWYAAVCEGYPMPDERSRMRGLSRSYVHLTEHRWKDDFELFQPWE